MGEPGSLWRAEEAAAYLGFAPTTLQRKARRGEVPYFNVFGEQRWSQDLLDDWLRGACLVRHASAQTGPEDSEEE